MTTNKTYTPILIDSVLAAADLQQKRFVGFDGNCCTAGAKALGVVDVTTEKGQYAPVAVLGTLLVEAGGTIAVGDAIASDGEGRAVKVADSAIANGYAKDAGTEGQEIRIVRGIQRIFGRAMPSVSEQARKVEPDVTPATTRIIQNA